MIGLPAGTRVWLAAGATDMRKGFDGLAALVQEKLPENPFSGHVLIFRGRRGDRIKLLGGTASACACSPSAWSAAASSGRRPTVARCI